MITKEHSTLEPRSLCLERMGAEKHEPSTVALQISERCNVMVVEETDACTMRTKRHESDVGELDMFSRPNWTREFLTP